MRQYTKRHSEVFCFNSFDHLRRGQFIYQNKPEPDEAEGLKAVVEKGGKPADLKEKYDQARGTFLGKEKAAEGNHMSGLIKEHISKLEAEKSAKTAAIRELKTKTAETRKKEAWCDKPEGSTATAMSFQDTFSSEKSADKIAKEVRLNYDQDPELQKMLEKLGLKQNQANIELLLTVVTKITTDYIKRMNTTDEKTIMGEAKKGIQEGLLRKVMAVLSSLLAIADSKADGFGSALEVLETFSDFTGTDFCKKGLLQNAQGELETLLLQDESVCKTLVENFTTYLGQNKELKTLDLELVKEQSALAKFQNEKPDIDAMVKSDTLKVPKVEISIPTGADEAAIRAAFEKGIRASLEEGQPALAENIKLEAIAFFMAKVEALNPKPASGEIFIFQDGVIEKNTGPGVKAKQQEEQKAEEAAKAGNKSGPEAVKGPASTMESLAALGGIPGAIQKLIDWISKMAEKLMPTIMNWINQRLEGPFDFAANIKDWTKFNDAGKKEIQNFYTSAKNSKKIDQKHLLALFQDPESLEQVLDHKAGFNPISWDTYLQRGIDEKEFPATENLKPSEVADRIISRKTVEHATPIQKPEPPPKPDNPRRS